MGSADTDVAGPGHLERLTETESFQVSSQWSGEGLLKQS